jgi:galactonate dehydratase
MTERQIKLTAVKTAVGNAKLRNWIFVRVETDIPGLYGLDARIQMRGVLGAIEDLARFAGCSRGP